VEPARRWCWSSFWTTRGLQAQAQLNLGLPALQRGELDEAAEWYRRPARGRARAYRDEALAEIASVDLIDGEAVERLGLIVRAAISA